MGEVVGCVDVDAEERVAAHDERQSGGNRKTLVPFERLASVGEGEVGTGRDDGHVGAVTDPVGDQGDCAGRAQPVEGSRAREVTVRDDDVVGAERGESGDATAHRAVESGSRRPQHLRTGLLGPCSDLAVVAHDVRMHRPRGREHDVRREPGEVDPLLLGEDR